MPSQECIQAVQQLVELNEQLNIKNSENRAQLATINAEINDLLHMVEYLELPASVMSQVAKKLKVLYKSRRVVKEDIIVADNILQHKKDAATELKNSDLRVAKYASEAEASFARIFAKQ